MKVRAIIATVAFGAATAVFTAAAAAQAAKTDPAKAAPAKAAAAGRVIEITSDDTMKFNLASIDAKPGETITIKLINKGTMPKMAMGHNFVLLKTGTDVNAFSTAAVMAGQTEYVPTDAKLKAQVIASTKIAGPGETVEVTFKAPAVAGAYDYICSFPGHFALMKGKLNVK